MRVHLGRDEVGVAEEFLDAPQVRAERLERMKSSNSARDLAAPDF